MWEYFLEGRFVDAVWFPEALGSGVESEGKNAPARFPLKGAEVVLCEAKHALTPELVGQALVYSVFAVRAGAKLRGTIIFAGRGSGSMRDAAKALRLSVVVGRGTLEPPTAPLAITSTGTSPE